jgi:predicted naringenin-chalcone synthase
MGPGQYETGMTQAYINQIETAVPDFDVHRKFIDFAPQLLTSTRDQNLFARMAARADIEHRYSFLPPAAESSQLDAENFYSLERFPSTQARMAFYKDHAFDLAGRALKGMDVQDCTHLIITTCTGFYAPGLDWQIVNHFGLRPDVERTTVGFMGCHAAISALRLANHIVRSREDARVLIVNLELCTLHMQRVDDLEKILFFLIFADGCAACIVSAAPQGLALKNFHSTLLGNTPDYIMWHVGNEGFEMELKGEVPGAISAALSAHGEGLLEGQGAENIDYWAVHPGGRSILDAVNEGLNLEQDALRFSRDILRRYGNMSSATVMFVLQNILREAAAPAKGCAMAFGPGLTVESMLFQTTPA